MRARITIESHATALTDSATVVLPAATHYETEGVYVSMNGRAQRLRPGAPPPEGAAPGWEILIALAHRLGAPPAHRTAAGVFARAAGRRPALAGLDYDVLGVLGRPRRRRRAGVAQRPQRPASAAGTACRWSPRPASSATPPPTAPMASPPCGPAPT